MRKLDLKDYTVKLKVPDRMNPLQEIEAEVPFFVKTSIINVLFTPALQLSSAETVRQNVLAMKIDQCEDEVILENEEYDRVKKAFDTHKGFDRTAVELINRINNAGFVEKE